MFSRTVFIAFKVYAPTTPVCIGVYSSFLHKNLQSVGLPKRSSTSIRKQEVHSNGLVLDDTVLQDPEVTRSSLGYWLFN